MKTVDIEGLKQVLKALMGPYRERVPDVEKITGAMIEKGMIDNQDDIVNDHIAFRTMGVPNLGIASFEKIFLNYGYTKKDYYFFEGKKLNAYWYAPPQPEFPRIFISELRVEDLSTRAQEIIKKYTGNIDNDPVDGLDLDNPSEVGNFFYKPLWDLPTLSDFNTLAQESEYAAWVIYNRYYLNHYTISVHDLPEAYNTIEKFNAFLESIGVKLNSSGGKVKISEDGLLKQSSSIAQMIEADFAGGETAEIAGSYVEFAERLPLPGHVKQSDLVNCAQRRDGFESANADKIFESTYSEQTNALKSHLQD
ncbi:MULTISPECIES: DUF1338 domain-containing protein [Flavobacteriaceae]|uniref:DUF1338 domain-containing protein n=1 Tax=Flavobacteriaceae TaxID=49546 RepID=UPI00234AF6DE|nr:DUF1338 domain-containing protein [Muricauda sp. SP22]MDC6362383.1 DUF1338 domain-containing protein [Muricauda sp. SP22]